MLFYRESDTIMTYLSMRDDRFSMAGLSAGKYTIGYLLLGTPPVELLSFTLAEGEQKILDVDTRSWIPDVGILNVRIVSEVGHLIHDAEVWIEQAGQTIVRAGHYREGYRLIAPSGSYTLVVRCHAHQDYTEPILIQQCDIRDHDSLGIFRNIIVQKK